jgi:hypothetical protein
MIDRRKVIKDETKSALKLLSELPSHGKRRGGVVQDITDEMQSSELARNWRAINDERRDNDIGNLGMVLLRTARNNMLVEQIPHSMLLRAPD